MLAPYFLDIHYHCYPMIVKYNVKFSFITNPRLLV